MSEGSRFARGSVVALGLLAVAAEKPSLPAFPGAEGWGCHTPGGRGGKGIYVTNLNPDKDDSAKAMPSGYTAVEMYVNELAEKLR